jgi:hypothetical protein
VASIAMLRRVGFRLVDDRHGGDPQAHLYVLTFLPAGSAAGSSAGSTGEGQT